MGDSRAYLNCSRAIVAKPAGLKCLYLAQKFAVAKDGALKPISKIVPVTKWDLDKDIRHCDAKPVPYELRAVLR